MANYARVIAKRLVSLRTKLLLKGTQWPTGLHMVAVICEDRKRPTLELFLGEQRSERLSTSNFFAEHEPLFSATGLAVVDALQHEPALTGTLVEDGWMFSSYDGLERLVGRQGIPDVSTFMRGFADTVISKSSDLGGILKKNNMYPGPNRGGDIHPLAASGTSKATLGLRTDLDCWPFADPTVWHGCLVGSGPSYHALWLSPSAVVESCLLKAGSDPEREYFPLPKSLVTDDDCWKSVVQHVKPGYTVFISRSNEPSEAEAPGPTIIRGSGVTVTTNKAAKAVCAVRLRTGWLDAPIIDVLPHQDTPILRSWASDPLLVARYATTIAEANIGVPQLPGGADESLDDIRGAAPFRNLAALEVVEAKSDFVYRAPDKANVEFRSELIDGVTVHQVIMSETDRFLELPLDWFKRTIGDGVKAGAVSEAEAGKVFEELDKFPGMLLRTVEYAKAVMLPENIVERTDTYREYGKSREKACKDNDLLEREFVKGVTYGALQKTINGSRSLRTVFQLSDAQAAVTLESDVFEGGALVGTGSPLTRITHVVGGNEVSLFVPGDNEVLGLIARGVDSSSLSEAELAVFLGVTVDRVRAERLDGAELGAELGRVRSDEILGGKDSWVGYTGPEVTVKGYPDYKRVSEDSIQQGYKIAMISRAAVPYGPKVLDYAMRDTRL